MRFHPGEYLKDELEARNYIASDIPLNINTVNGIIKGVIDINDDIANVLGRFFRINPQCWINLQKAYDLQ